MIFTQSYAELARADVVWEVATERGEIKAKIFEAIEQHVDAERIAAIRARKTEDRARAKAKAERRGQVPAAQGQRPGAQPPSHARPGQHGRPWQGQRPMRRRPGGR